MTTGGNRADELEAALTTQAAIIEDLRQEVAALRAQAPDSDPPTERLSRRKLLLTAGATAAAAAAAAVVATEQPAAAANNDPLLVGSTANTATSPTRLNTTSTNDAFWINHTTNAPGSVLAATSATATTAIYGRTGSASPFPRIDCGVMGDSTGQPGVVGASSSQLGVLGQTASGPAAVKGERGASGITPQASAVWGDGDDVPGVVGTSGTTHGVIGVTNSTSAITAGVRGETLHPEATGPGVLGITAGTGAGVQGTVTGTASAVRGDVDNPVSPAAALFGVTNGTGSGVTGKVVVPTSAGAGVFGSTAGTGNAIRGRTTSLTNNAPCGRFNHDGSGPGMQATSAAGVGATFQGSVAAVRLVPQANAGPPPTGTHQAGELIVDVNGAMHVCTVGGSPGTWRTVAFV